MLVQKNWQNCLTMKCEKKKGERRDTKKVRKQKWASTTHAYRFYLEPATFLWLQILSISFLESATFLWLQLFYIDPFLSIRVIMAVDHLLGSLKDGNKI
jgi:hypothetical protein